MLKLQLKLKLVLKMKLQLKLKLHLKLHLKLLLLQLKVTTKPMKVNVDVGVLTIEAWIIMLKTVLKTWEMLSKIILLQIL